MQPANEAPKSLLFLGKTEIFKLPSGNTVRLRESNGEDESKLSTVKDAVDGSNLLNFLSGVVVGFNEQDIVLSPKEIGEWHRNDIYYALLCQRILTHGDNLEIQTYCSNPTCSKHKSKTKYPFTVDVPLQEYLLSCEEPAPTAAKPYIKGAAKLVEDILPKSKLKVRFKIESFQRYMTNVANTAADLNKNLTIIEHDTEWMMDDQYQPLTVLSALSASQAGELRNSIKNHDPLFLPVASYECPACNTPHEDSILQVPTFFYPDERVQ